MTRTSRKTKPLAELNFSTDPSIKSGVTGIDVRLYGDVMKNGYGRSDMTAADSVKAIQAVRRTLARLGYTVLTGTMPDGEPLDPDPMSEAMGFVPPRCGECGSTNVSLKPVNTPGGQFVNVICRKCGAR